MMGDPVSADDPSRVQARKLGKNGELFKSIFNALTDGVSVLDHDLTIKRVNPWTKAMFSARKPLVGRRCYEVYQNRSAPCEGCPSLEAIASGQPHSATMIFEPDKGRRVWLEVSAFPLRDSEGRAIGVIEHIKDVTARLHTQEALREAEANYSKLVEESLTGIYIVQDDRIAFANHQFAEIYGYERDELLGVESWHLVHPEDWAFTDEMRTKRLNGESVPLEYESRGLTKDGRVIWIKRRNSLIEFQGRPAILGNVVDATLRKNAEEALRASEAEKQAILDAAIDSIRLVDTDLKILWANRTAAAGLHLEPEDIIGRHCYEVFGGRETLCNHCPTHKALSSGRVEHGIMLKKDYAGMAGDTYWDCYGVPIKDESGRIENMIQIARHVTAQMEAEKELKRRHEELKAVNGVLLKITREYDLAGMGRVLQEIMEKFYPRADTLLFLLGPNLDSFYFPRTERGRGRESCFETARMRIKNPGVEQDLLDLLTRSTPQPVFSMKAATIPRPLAELAEGFDTWMAVPVEVEDTCYGLFLVGSNFELGAAPDDLIFIESLIRQISGVLRNQVAQETREEAYQRQLTGPDSFHGIVGRNQAMQEIYTLILAVADSKATILITGESGTGKELVARAIHKAGRYDKTPFIAAHCSSFVPTLVHSELFGHEKGAFTGATSRRLGRIERAQGGILFLDEVADLPLETQVLLLRFLQDKSFERVGGQHPVQANVRIIAATNKNVEKEMNAGRLREDFYYRLNVIPLRIPPLRERITDVPLLASNFLRTFSLIEGKDIHGFDTEAMRFLMDYDWPGNVRELQNTVARCVALSTGRWIGVDSMPERVVHPQETPPEWSLAKNEKTLVERVLRECNWNKHEAARLLDISRGTLYSKIKKYDLTL